MNKRKEWSFRINEEFRISTSGYFITLTYDDDHIRTADNGLHTLVKSDLQAFLKRLRQSLVRLKVKYQKLPHNAGKPLRIEKIRYYAIGEYGDEGNRPHYHLLLFNLPNWFSRVELMKFLEQCWSEDGKQIGIIDVGTVTPASIHYCTKYMMKDSKYFDGVQKPFALMSTKPPIGVCYLENTIDYHRNNSTDMVTLAGGKLIRLPRIMRDAIFNETDKHIIKENKYKMSEYLREKSYKKKSEKGIDPLKDEIQKIQENEKLLLKRSTKKRKL